jgi:RES domain-containing protein
MSRIWRICKKEHVKGAFTGEGARIYGGRFNHKGTAVAYCASSLALAALEVFVHVDATELPDDLMAIPAEVPEKMRVERLTPQQLPKTWRAAMGPDVLRDIGTTWAQRGATALLYVPSAIIPEEENVLINPTHPDFSKIRLGLPRAFAFDPRMRKR